MDYQPADELDAYQAKIVEVIKDQVPVLNQVEPHYGTFNVDEITRRIIDAPAAFVALPNLRPGNTYSTGQISFLAEVMIVIIAKHDGPPPDGDAAIIARRAMKSILALAMWNSFGSKARAPTELAGDELHWDRLDPQGLAMCVVSWIQEIFVTPDVFLPTEQSKLPDGSFPPLPADAPDKLTTKETAHTGPEEKPLSVRQMFESGIFR